jgi:hypothetical protein
MWPRASFCGRTGVPARLKHRPHVGKRTGDPLAASGRSVIKLSSTLRDHRQAGRRYSGVRPDEISRSL